METLAGEAVGENEGKKGGNGTVCKIKRHAQGSGELHLAGWDPARF
jgi:hypothetical protein